jgi:F-type H+-transporting ATPase subunit alpha
MIVPVGLGQRELVIGDRKTGKSSFCLQTVLNQARAGTTCVYGIIGKRGTYVKNITNYFEENGILNKVAVITSMASDPVGLVFLVPYFAMAVAEHFRDQGKNVLVVLDDLTTCKDL